MTPQNKQLVKRIALTVGILAVVTVLTILIVKSIRNAQDRKAQEKEDEKTNPPESTGSAGGYSSGGSSGGSMNTLNGRTFTKTEIEKMQAYMLTMGQFAQNQLIISEIRDNGGIDGKIGNGFKNALAECIRLQLVSSLNSLYEAAMRQ